MKNRMEKASLVPYEEIKYRMKNQEVCFRRKSIFVGMYTVISILVMFVLEEEVFLSEYTQ